MRPHEAEKVTGAQLNTLYDAIKQHLKQDDEGTKLFVPAEREWIKFRKAECRFVSETGAMVYPGFFGTMHPLVVS